MAKVMEDRTLDPVKYGEIEMKRRTKGTPYTNGGTGFNLNFNHMPPGTELENQDMAMDVKETMSKKPFGPILV